MSCRADLPFVGRSAAVEAGEGAKTADRQKRRLGSPKIIPSWEGWLARDRVASQTRWVVASKLTPPQGLAALAPPKRGFTFSKIELRSHLNHAGR